MPTNAPYRVTGPINFLVLAGFILGWPCVPATGQSEEPIERISVAIIPPLDLARDAESERWRYAFVPLLRSQLRSVGRLRLVPESSVAFAFRELGLGPTKKLTPTQVQKLGEAIEARRVVWGQYLRMGNEWQVTAQLLNVATGEPSVEFHGQSTNWLAMICKLRNDILESLGVVPTPEEMKRMERPITTSTTALELMMQALVDSKQGKPLPKVEEILRAAISMDAEFALARQALSHILLLQNRLEEATEEAQRSVKDRPDLPQTHFALGKIHIARGFFPLALREFRESAVIDPDWPDNYVQLSNIAEMRSNWPEVVSELEKAEKLAPHDAQTLAKLGSAYARIGESDKAWAKLTSAELLQDSDLGVEQMIAEGYRLLNDAPKAVEHFENYLTGAEKVGLQLPLVEDSKVRLSALKERLTTCYVKATMPSIVTSNDLRKVCQQQLSPGEYDLIVDPLRSSPEMQAWAEQLALNATNDLHKAKRLFDGLTRRPNGNRAFKPRTAEQSFKSWPNPSATLTCQEYTYLYLALARHLNLKAFYVYVTVDYRGKLVSHSCAGVFCEGKALLVDPAYQWFGIPHQQFEFYDDLKVVAGYSAQSGDSANEEIALGLFPTWADVHFAVAIGRARRGKCKEASEALQIGLKLDSQSWRALYAQATVEACNQKWHNVISLSQRALSANGDLPYLRFVLATALTAQGNLAAAREEYRSYLQGETEDAYAFKARQAMAYINEAIPETSSRPTANRKPDQIGSNPQ